MCPTQSRSERYREEVAWRPAASSGVLPGPTSPCRVEEAQFDPEAGRLDLHLDFPAGSDFTCPSASGKAARPTARVRRCVDDFLLLERRKVRRLFGSKDCPPS